MRHKLVLWLLLLLAGFLIGVIVQYSRLQRVQQELSASTKQLGPCQSSQQLSQLRDTATMMYLEVVEKNYGKAGEYSKEVFDQAQQIASSTEDPALRNLLRDTLAARDQQGHGCRTGARILWAVKRPSSAAGHSPTPCALARGHPRPTRTLAKEPPIVQDLIFIRSARASRQGRRCVRGLSGRWRRRPTRRAGCG